MRKAWLMGMGALLMLGGGNGSGLAADVQSEEGKGESATGSAKAAPGKGDETVLDEVSVTATRVERTTKEVPSAIAVIGQERIENSRMYNVKDAISGTPGVMIDSKNGGYDARLIIRGAGQKANYGIREVMVMRDGVPMTDPDSFTRLDFIDPQDIERIEITKGPGSIHGAGSAGGVIQIISRSVFDQENRLRLGVGEQGTENLHLRHTLQPNDSNALSLTFSHRAQDNDWRRWNNFDTQQLSLKHGLQLAGGGIWESELSYSQADLQLPGSMNQDQFNAYLGNGRQEDTGDAWKHTGRYSEIWFFNSRLEREWGDFTFKPRIYATHWSHYHPVTGVVNVADDNWVYGTDLELGHRHTLPVLGEASLVTGVTVRQDRSDDARKYQYAEVESGRGRIVRTLSDRAGALLSSEDAINTLYGVYAMESVRPWERVTVDLGARYDRSDFDIDTNEIGRYDYGRGTYVDGDGFISTDKAFDLLSLSLGVSYALNRHVSLFATVAQSDQVPSSSEISSNPALDAATYLNYEFGIKGRAARWSVDASVYHTNGTDEIVSVYENGQTVFHNAGKTEKRGFELTLSRELWEGLTLGGSYAYADHRFREFMEPVTVNRVTVNEDRSGNEIPYTPPHQYGLFAEYAHDSGFKARLQTLTWSRYWMDNANTASYKGYEFLTNGSVSYEWQQHVFTLSAENLFDQRYAVEAKRDTRGTDSYSAGSPQTFLLSWTYKY